MELALPHVVVWTRGPGLGTDLVAALAAHPVEVSDVRGLIEARRAATGRTPMLVVLMCPADPIARVAEAAAAFPGKPILLFADTPHTLATVTPPADTWIEERPADQPLQEICWQVIETLGRTALGLDTPDSQFMPLLVDLDTRGEVGAAYDLRERWFFPGPHPQPGSSLLSLVQPEDHAVITQNLKHASRWPSFFSLRVLDRDGSPHPMYGGMRAVKEGRLLLILQPLIDCAPIVGRRRGTRDPLTGLIDRWELWRQMEQEPASSGSSIVMFARLDTFEAFAATMDFQRVDEVFDRVASAIMQVFPWPAAPSRLSGGAFLLLVRNASLRQSKIRARRLIRMVSRIGGDVTSDMLRYGLSIGLAQVCDGDHDLAVRLAETAVREAHAAGGNRVVEAGPQTLIRSRVGDLAANLELDTWDVWLQPVVRGADGWPVFHEALARFGTTSQEPVSRPDFFTTGRLEGLLNRFDRLVLLRALELLSMHPHLRLSVNVTRETFAVDTFPEHFIGLLRDALVDSGRVILEISPACLTMPSNMVRRRLVKLETAGIEVALDDFGSGVCSLRHLTDFPLSIVKLDELVSVYVGDDPLQRNFVRMVVNLCRARGIRTVAEYTRTHEQMERLAEDGVDYFQGELLGMAMPAAEALAHLARVT
jgi:EAL domain-containing protein (putative c-di-GMP-specific phosphodiesterase class I)/GGDEF domain-containing protein